MGNSCQNPTDSDLNTQCLEFNDENPYITPSSQRGLPTLQSSDASSFYLTPHTKDFIYNENNPYTFIDTKPQQAPNRSARRSAITRPTDNEHRPLHPTKLVSNMNNYSAKAKIALKKN